MPSARNDEQTKEMFTPALIEAVRYLVDKIYEENKDAVDAIVYSTSTMGTGDLREAWATKASGGGGTAHGEFNYDPSKMKSHPSAVWHGVDVKETLIYIVYQGLAGDFGLPPGFVPAGKRYASSSPYFGGPWTTARNAWTELIKRLGRGKIDQYMEQGFRHAGLNVIKNSGGKFISDGNN